MRVQALIKVNHMMEISTISGTHFRLISLDTDSKQLPSVGVAMTRKYL